MTKTKIHYLVCCTCLDRRRLPYSSLEFDLEGGAGVDWVEECFDPATSLSNESSMLESDSSKDFFAIFLAHGFFFEVADFLTAFGTCLAAVGPPNRLRLGNFCCNSAFCVVG